MEQNKSYKAHALLFPFPAQGHINPILQFAKRLASKNVKATVAITVSVAKTFPSDHPTTNLLRIATVSDGFDTGGYTEAPSPESYSDTFRQVGSRTLSQLITNLSDSGQPVTALIFDPVVPWAIDVGERFGLVKVAFFTQTCAVSNVYYHVNKGLLELPIRGDVVSVPGLPELRRSEVPSFVADPEAYPHYLSVCLGQFDKIHEADWVLQSTFYELEPEVIDWMSKLWRLRTVGPMVPSMYLDKRIQDDTQYGINLYNPNTTQCNNWLSQRSPNSVVYVSFGSVASPDPEQMHEVASALKQSGYYFLWVVREVDQHKLPDNFMGETSDKGLVVTWCPQLEVLSGGRVGCFVTHCGLSSTMEAMSLGVPVVAVPMWTDQCTNAKYVEDVWGIGVRVGVLRRGELGLKMREVMEGERGKVVKKNVVKWMGLAREAVEVGGSSDKNIDEFVGCL